MLTERGRTIRGMAFALALAALLAGTFFGDDDNFPFGPFRMYSTRNELNGRVNAPEFVGITTAGDEVPVRFEDLGLRRAEIDGRIAKLVDDPSIMGRLVEVRADLDPSLPVLTELRLYLHVVRLRDGRPAGEEIELLAVWKRDP